MDLGCTNFSVVRWTVGVWGQKHPLHGLVAPVSPGKVNVEQRRRDAFAAFMTLQVLPAYYAVVQETHPCAISSVLNHRYDTPKILANRPRTLPVVGAQSPVNGFWSCPRPIKELALSAQRSKGHFSLCRELSVRIAQE